ncbi:WhiB family transcriptional regulator [Streptomyces chartreusis]|uniref:WhiB family transcriptional regulator n=1 Tax=Streptomyces chartreusis TaxID=1969 RepID=UPI0033E51C04
MAEPRLAAGTIRGTKHLAAGSSDWRARQAERSRLGRLSPAIEQSASCAGKDPDLFFPKNANELELAKQICRGCPVVRECLVQALRMSDKYAVLGGTTPEERAALKRHLARKRRAVAA